MIFLESDAAWIILPSPEWGDEHTVDNGLKMKKMMDLSKVTFIRTPVIAVYNLKFQNMNSNKGEEMRLFMIASSGKKITMIDHSGYEWIGRILTDPLTVTHAAIRDNQFAIDFEGHVYGKVDFPIDA